MPRTIADLPATDIDAMIALMRSDIQAFQALVFHHILGWTNVREVGQHSETYEEGHNFWIGSPPADQTHLFGEECALPHIMNLPEALCIPRALMTRADAFDGHDRNSFFGFLSAQLVSLAHHKTGTLYATYDNLMLVGFLEPDIILRSTIHLIWWRANRKNGGAQ